MQTGATHARVEKLYLGICETVFVLLPPGPEVEEPVSGSPGVLKGDLETLNSRSGSELLETVVQTSQPVTNGPARHEEDLYADRSAFDLDGPDPKVLRGRRGELAQQTTDPRRKHVRSTPCFPSSLVQCLEGRDRA